MDTERPFTLEKEIEDWLWTNPQLLQGDNRVALVHQWLGRQVRVPSGVIDLLGINYELRPVVVELKRGPIDARAITQASRYAQDIRGAIMCNDRNWEEWDSPNAVSIVVVGTSIDQKSLMEATSIGVKVLLLGISLEFKSALTEDSDRIHRMYRDLYDSDLLAPFRSNTLGSR